LVRISPAGPHGHRPRRLGRELRVYAQPSLPLRNGIFLIPGLWVLQLWLKTEVSWDWAFLAAALGGAKLMILQALLHRLPRRLGELLRELEGRLEPVGLLWLMVGTWVALYLQDDWRQVLAVAVLMVVGMVELIVGLVYPVLTRTRRIGGMLCICLGIFSGAGIAHGLLQGMLMLASSLMTIGMAVLVLSSKHPEAKPSGPSDDEEAREEEAEIPAEESEPPWERTEERVPTTNNAALAEAEKAPPATHGRAAAARGGFSPDELDTTAEIVAEV